MTQYVVTGNISRHYGTPAIVAQIQYKDRNAVLRGANYATPVKYWMPFYGNYGIHDASWRREFGGTVYLTDGSHGCVNTPPAAMKVIFETMDSGTPDVAVLLRKSKMPAKELWGVKKRRK